MPFWGSVVLVAGLSALVVAAVFVIVHHTHRRMPERQVAEGGATDLSAPLPMYVRNEQELMTERELQAERERDEARESEQPRPSW
jgi:uncharacterized membrane protein YbjE (DUF340 family)